MTEGIQLCGYSAQCTVRGCQRPSYYQPGSAHTTGCVRLSRQPARPGLARSSGGAQWALGVGSGGCSTCSEPAAWLGVRPSSVWAKRCPLGQSNAPVGCASRMREVAARGWKGGVSLSLRPARSVSRARSARRYLTLRLSDRKVSVGTKSLSRFFGEHAVVRRSPCHLSC
jgi:hypothetical protein